MKIILLENIKSLGKKGDIKDVAEGYAQNFLLPKKLAALATKGAVKITEKDKARSKALEETEMKAMRELAEKLKNKKIIIRSREKSGKLFGSVTKNQIADELKKDGLEVLEKCIIMEEAIKQIGTYELEIRLSDQVKTKIALEVIGE